MRFLLPAILCLLVLPLGASAHDYEHQGISLVHPWIAEPPPGAPTAAGYVALFNEGEEDDQLVSVTADFAGRVSIHTMTMTDEGVMQMRPFDGPLVVPAGGDVMLEPGGLHIMFMDLVAPLHDGDSHAVVLTFEKAGDVTVDFTVQKRDDGMDMPHGDDG